MRVVSTTYIKIFPSLKAELLRVILEYIKQGYSISELEEAFFEALSEAILLSDQNE